MDSMWVKIEFIESGEKKAFRFQRSNPREADSGSMMDLVSGFVLSTPITYGHMTLSLTDPKMGDQYAY
jgi:hypothetical protein